MLESASPADSFLRVFLDWYLNLPYLPLWRYKAAEMKMTRYVYSSLFQGEGAPTSPGHRKSYTYNRARQSSFDLKIYSFDVI